MALRLYWSALLLGLLSCCVLAAKRKSGHPNIVVIVTDDQDIELGSMNYMPNVRKHIEREGAFFPNAYVTTPMCCPSRSSLLTGIYVHNHNVYTNNKNCSSNQWRRTFEPKTFANALANHGYHTGYFGKYLNEYNGNHVPLGWKEWVGLVRNSKFYNYTVSVNGNKVKHGNDYSMDYLPDLITNHSLSFLRRSKQFYPDKPVLTVMAYPGPHGPEDSAPQYQHMFLNETQHRTPAWNYAPNYDKQWILRHTGKMQDIHIKFTDILNTKRLQTLQSVDDAVDQLIEELKRLDELENTFIFYTSDHGYHLGQFGLVKGKAMPFEFDVRVPFYVRGPKVSRGIQIPEIIANIDIAPTMLEIARLPPDLSMDGKSILPLLMQKMGRRVTTWRDSVLIEKGKITREALIRMESASAAAAKCSSGKFPSPCKPGQRFECIFEDTWKLVRCNRRCQCKKGRKFVMDDDLRRVRGGLRRTAKHLRRSRREYEMQRLALTRNPPSVLASGETSAESENDDFGSGPVNSQDKELVNCVQFAKNQSVICLGEEEYQDPTLWKKKKEEVDGLIKGLRQKLNQLKGLQATLRQNRPHGASNGRRPVGSSESDDECNCQKDKGRKLRKQEKFANTECTADLDKMNCFTHDNDHWKTPPLWTEGPFCFCQNANNNTFWCVRTINATHNFLYCEFITGFTSYYNLKDDPYQLRNVVSSLSRKEHDLLKVSLNRLRRCKGARECTVRYRVPKPNPAVLANVTMSIRDNLLRRNINTFSEMT